MVGTDEAMVASVCSRLLGRAIVAFDRIHGGRNNQVFRLDCEPGAQPIRYIAKRYCTIPDDSRDRLGTEYRSLHFLRSRGIAGVPAPIAMDADTRCAVYEFLPGVRASLAAARDGDIDQAVGLLADLKAVARLSREDEAAAASEACFSIAAIVAQLSVRAARLRALPGDAPGSAELRRFLDARFDPFMTSLVEWTGEQARRHGLRLDEDLPFDERTLSPSDFGLHNALRDEHDRLAFIDFEYFGWDDPAKTIADFLLHPGMTMTERQRQAFAAGALRVFSDVAALEARARIVYPWFGLKWCLILLNEFVPEYLRRRQFAGVADGDPYDVLHRQLDRAGRMLDRIGTEYRHNPYFGG